MSDDSKKYVPWFVKYWEMIVLLFLWLFLSALSFPVWPDHHSEGTRTITAVLNIAAIAFGVKIIFSKRGFWQRLAAVLATIYFLMGIVIAIWPSFGMGLL